jgi:SpoVK/Ycf46/Vps4 family AAA+-type ATPase
VEELKKLSLEIVQLSRLALTGSRQDVELYVKRLVRKLDKWNPEAAEDLINILNQIPKRSSVVRSTEIETIPVDRDSRLNLLRVESSQELEDLVLTSKIADELEEIVAERKKNKQLLLAGIEPSKAVLFVGPPGVGKSLSAKYLARELNLPLLTLDLSAVMSSFLGRTGTNIRNVFDFAKTSSCVLFLDELDSIAKKRDDNAEVGELKRLVTVLLQEMDNWPSDNLIVAATNHEDLLDPAVWRRFDRVISFDLPDEAQIFEIIKTHLSPSMNVSADTLHIFSTVLKGWPHAEIIRELNNLKKSAILGDKQLENVILNYIEDAVSALSKEDRISVAVSLNKGGHASQRKVQKMTGVSRDTLRKKSLLGTNI